MTTFDPKLESPDDFYEALLDAHRDLTHDESDALNARLILLLANHVGDIEVLREAVAEARTSGGKPVADSAQRHSTLLKRHP